MANTRVAMAARRAQKDFEQAARRAQRVDDPESRLAAQILAAFAAAAKVEADCAERDDDQGVETAT